MVECCIDHDEEGKHKKINLVERVCCIKLFQLVQKCLSVRPINSEYSLGRKHWKGNV